MRNSYKEKGFTLIELLLVMALIASLMTLIPKLFQRGPRYERINFIARLNSLSQFAVQQAFVTNRIHAIVFNLDRRTIQVKRWPLKKKVTDDRDLEPLIGQSRSLLLIPVQYEIRQFFIENVDEIARRTGGTKTGTIYFFTVPEGLTQQVTINMVDKKDTIEGKMRHVGLVLNPFTAQFSIYDTFQT